MYASQCYDNDVQAMSWNYFSTFFNCVTIHFLNFNVTYYLKFYLLHIVISKTKVTPSREEWILVRPVFLLNATDVGAFIYNQCNETNKLTNIKIIFLHTIYQNSDMFRSTLTFFTELPNISRAYVKTWIHYWLLKHKLDILLL